MLRFFIRSGVPLAWCVSALAAGPQPAGSGRPDPLDPAASTPRATYDSAFKTYRRLGDPQATPWPQANETVSRIGGWRAYAREAQAPEAPASAPAARPPTGPGGQPR